MPLLLDDPYCVVRLELARNVVRFTRTERPYASLDDVQDVHERTGAIFDRLGRERHALLVDMRRAPLNNRPEFEQAAARGRRILLRDFGRVAVMVQTPMGALQVARHLRQDRVACEVFTDEAPALEYLGRVEPAPISGVTPSGSAPSSPPARVDGRR